MVAIPAEECSTRNPSINATFETLAAFWPPKDQSAFMAGVLTARKGLLHFVTAPTYERLSEAKAQELMLGFGKVHDGPLDSIECLTGRTKEGKCTLFSAFALEDPGVLDHGTREKISSIRFQVDTAVIGLKLNSSAGKEIDSAAFRLTGMQEWMPRAWGTEYTESHVIHQIPRNSHEVFRFNSTTLDSEIFCEVRVANGGKARGSNSIKPIPLLRIKPKTKQSLNWFLALIPRIENFFSLLLGTSVAPKQIVFFKNNKTGYLVQRRSRKKEKPNFQLSIRCPYTDVARALEIWLAVPEAEQAIEKVVLGNVRKSDLFVETEFLGLAQGLEAFGRIHFKNRLIPKAEFRIGLKQIGAYVQEVWGDTPITKRVIQSLHHADEISYGERLGLIWNMLDPEFAKKLFGDRDKTIRKIVHTRNHLTHLGGKPSAHVAQGGHEIFMLNQKLHALLRCAMLIDLGIPMNNLVDPITYQATRWR